MAKKQTRRSVSVRGETYSRLKQQADKIGCSMSELVEKAIAKTLEYEASRPKKNQPRLDSQELQEAKRFFTF